MKTITAPCTTHEARPRGRAAFIVLCVLTLVHCADAAYAQAAVGQPIVEVRAEQEGKPVVDPLIAGLIETTVGEPLSMRDVRETTTHLMNLRRFEDVQAIAEPAANGVRVRYVLIPLHPVDRVEFRGTLGVSEGDLRRIVSDRFGASPSATRSAEIAETLRAVYRRRGFPAATFTPRIVETHDPDRATMVIDVEAGQRAVIRSVQVFQVDAREEATLIGVPNVATGRAYDGDEVDRELLEWVNLLKARGYYEARATHGVLFPDDAYVTVNVARGPRVVVAFSGDALAADERERLVPVRTEGSADEDLLEDANRAITDYLRARGYRDAKVSYTSEEGDGELTITFDIRRGPRYIVDRVTISGNTAIPTAELQEILRIDGGDPFVQSTLAGRAGAIANAYRTRGFTRVEVTPAEAVLPAGSAADDDRRIEMAVVVVEGPRAVVRSVTFEGQSVFTEQELRAFAAASPGRAYSQPDVVNGRDRIDLEYRNRGYESVVVAASTALADDDTQADVRYAITEGPQFIVDHIIIIGNERTSTATISRELLLREGEPLGYSALLGSRARLAALGLFRRVDVQVLQHGGEPRRDVLVQIEEADPTTLGVGGGLEGGFRVRPGEGGQAEEQFELAPRAFFEIGRRNLWGKNRSVNLLTRVSLRPRDVVASEGGVRFVEGQTLGGYGFNEYRVVGTFREPGIFRSPAEMLVTGILEQAIRTSFNFSRRVARAEVGMRMSPAYSAAGRYSYEHTRLFDEKNITPEEQPLIDRLFPQVRLSKFAGSFIRDTRNDVLDTSRGTFLFVDADLAARTIGSEVGFIKTYVQAFTYRQLPTARRVVLALAARVGAAHGFPREVPRVDGTGEPVLGDDGVQVVDVVQDLPASERFFAGGETTVRGFSLDRLGNERTISASGFPTGGNSVVVLNSELRVALLGPLQAVGFVDAGNVFPRAGDIDFTDLRPAAGIGMRYRSPVGPIRIDWGFNLNRRELVPGTLERSNVVHISLGQAF
jgi:outer membrane protein insertion porin family